MMKPQSALLLPILSLLPPSSDAFSVPSMRRSLQTEPSPPLKRLSSGSDDTDSVTSDRQRSTPKQKRKIELTWCNHGECSEALREQVVGEHNHIELGGPATGQVAYSWEKRDSSSEVNGHHHEDAIEASTPAVLFLVKQDDAELAGVAGDTIVELLDRGVQVLIDDTLAGDLRLHREQIDLSCHLIRSFRPKPVPGFGTGIQLNTSVTAAAAVAATAINNEEAKYNNTHQHQQQEHNNTASPADLSDPDLIVTLGGDGTIMHAAHIFSGPVPPILPIAGGSMGFLTPFAREEILDAILIALGMNTDTMDSQLNDDNENNPLNNDDSLGLKLSNRANNNMLVEDITRESYEEKPSLSFGRNSQICISMRMRLDCRIFGSDGTLRSRYNVLNEVVIDRGSSPYLASLECFCDDVHLTTVQADGIM
ncbi:hypothetical protein ACHAWO_002097 [Cyclotella atomus]|uniref:NAD(+) kinase n=1 Tax=Cyclotella atomus TaxID=382360 RepID=A0ABD3Q1H2_9STRA